MASEVHGENPSGPLRFKLFEILTCSYQVKQTYMSVKEEVESKTKKLTKLFNKLQNAEQEIKDLQVVTQIWHKSGKFIELNIQTKPFGYVLFLYRTVSAPKWWYLLELYRRLIEMRRRS